MSTLAVNIAKRVAITAPMIPNRGMRSTFRAPKLYIDAYAKGYALDAATFLAHEPAYNHTTRLKGPAS